jgi:hypothetical protein
LKVARAADAAWLIATLKLGEAYLRGGAYTQAVSVADSVVAETDRLWRNGTPAAKTYGEPLDCVMSLEAIRVRAKWCRVQAFAERGSRLKTMLAEIQSLRFTRLPTEERSEIEAACLDCTGWILTQQARLDQAVSVLERAIALDATADAHYHLACAYEHIAESAGPADRIRALRRARESARRIATLDLEQTLGEATADLLQRLDTLDARFAQHDGEPPIA